MPKFVLTEDEKTAMQLFASGFWAVFRRDAESIGHIADYIGQYGPEKDTGSADAVLMECMKIIVDAKARQK